MRTRISIIGLIAALATVLALSLGTAAHAVRWASEPAGELAGDQQDHDNVQDPLVRPPVDNRPQRQHPPGDLPQPADLVRLPREGLRHLARRVPAPDHLQRGDGPAADRNRPRLVGALAESTALDDTLTCDSLSHLVS